MHSCCMTRVVGRLFFAASVPGRAFNDHWIPVNGGILYETQESEGVCLVHGARLHCTSVNRKAAPVNCTVGVCKAVH